VKNNVYIAPFCLIFLFGLILLPPITRSVYADVSIIPDDVKKAGQESALREAQDNDNRKCGLTGCTDSEYKIVNESTKPQGASFIRLKPKSVSNGGTVDQKIYHVEFMDSGPRERKTDSDSNNKPLIAVKKIEDPDKNGLMQKEAAKQNKTEVSLGYKLSPFSEIYLGKGFLVERKDNTSFQPRDDGWRIKFQTNF
jgi:hypothetical protein